MELLCPYGLTLPLVLLCVISKRFSEGSTLLVVVDESRNRKLENSTWTVTSLTRQSCRMAFLDCPKAAASSRTICSADLGLVFNASQTIEGSRNRKR